MRALISSNLVVQVGNEFPVAAPLFWVDCPSNCVAYEWGWNGSVVYQLPAPPVPVPQVVTPRQARLALLQQGKLAAVNTAVAASDEATKISWEFAVEIVRTSPLVATLGAAIGLTDSQIDDLFVLAATL